MFVRTPYNYDVDAVSRETALDCSGDPGLTQQEFKEETDINEIVRRFGLTGELPEVVNVPVSGDFTGISDFQSAQNAVLAAQRSFMELPAELRAKFQNDPQRLMEFVADDRNYEEAKKLGLLKADVILAAPEVPPVPADTPKA